MQYSLQNRSNTPIFSFITSSKQEEIFKAQVQKNKSGKTLT
jgi:hypothetical protein